MAYVVTKTIAGRPYRYRVESLRDPETGKRRSRWTYLGRAPTAASAGRAPKRRGDARERLLDAVERLVGERPFSEVTADAIARSAGLAHGTFYRHFADKRAALLAALDRVRRRRGPAFELLEDQPASQDSARAALRRLVETILGAPAQHPALLRAYYGLVTQDAELRREWHERRSAAVRRLAEHLHALRRRALTSLEDPDAVAAALFVMLDGFYREAVGDGQPVSPQAIAGAAAVVDRAVFDNDARKEEG